MPAVHTTAPGRKPQCHAKLFSSGAVQVFQVTVPHSRMFLIQHSWQSSESTFTHLCSELLVQGESISNSQHRKLCVFPDGQTSKEDKSGLIYCPCFGVLSFLKCGTGFPQPACGTLGLHPNNDAGSLPISCCHQCKAHLDPKVSLGLFVTFLLVPHPCQSCPSSSTTVLPKLLVEETKMPGLWTVIFFYRKPFTHLFEKGEQPSLEPLWRQERENHRDLQEFSSRTKHTALGRAP